MSHEHFEWKTIVMPRYQAAIFGGAAVVAMLGATVFAKEILTIWQISAAFLLLFSMACHIQSLLVPNYKQYLIESVYSFVITLILLGGVARMLSGVSIFDAGSYRTIYIVILVSFFFFMAIILFMKTVIGYLDNKDKKLGKR